MPVTIKSDTQSGHFEITLERTGNDTGTIRVKTWPPGHNPGTAPQKNDLTKLYHIRVGHSGLKTVCLGDVIGSDPTITCSISAPPAEPSVTVDVKGTFGGWGDDTTMYVVSLADRNALADFINGSGFPPL